MQLQINPDFDVIYVWFIV